MKERVCSLLQSGKKCRKRLLAVCLLISLCWLDVGIAGAKTTTYNRDYAVSYALRHAKSYNLKYVSYTSDCTNFVSQCLEAGGYKQTDTWYCGYASSSKKWSVAKLNYEYLLKSKKGEFFKKYSMRKNYTKPSSYVNVLKGSVIYYDWTGNKSIDHAAIVTKSGWVKDTTKFETRISQHTADRKNAMWHLRSHLRGDEKEQCIYTVVKVGE